MALIKDYLTRKLLNENHPAMDKKRCLNQIQRKKSCNICETVCPREVFRNGEADWELCDNCGACVPVCPTRCLCPSALAMADVLDVCSRVAGDMTVSCSEREGEASFRLPCLASMPWELIAFFALGGRASLLYGNCADCTHAMHMERWPELLECVRSFLGENTFADKVRCLVNSETPAPNGYSRRDAFTLLFSKSKSTLGSLLPGDSELSPDGMFFRQLLAYRARQLAPAEGFHWHVPAFTDACDACGLCTKLCPSGTLHRVDGDTADGEKTWYMSIIPWRCTGCGLCRERCPSGGLTDPDLHALRDPARPLITPVQDVPCIKCGEPSRGGANGHCARCRGEMPRKIIW